ncbi:MAG: YlbF family regulator [Clostridiales bacterium]|nr:YlbF family regulator [Clostridiales bacterium]
MEEIGRNVDALVEAIRRSEVYVTYKEQEARLNRNPELRDRVLRFRGENFRLQNEAHNEELFDVAERLTAESAELRADPVVSAYLDAELALCKLMQKICYRLTDGIEIQVPDL